MSLRWENYVMGRGDRESRRLWEEAAMEGGGSSMAILGLGFDPRCLVVLTALLESEAKQELCVAGIELPDSSIEEAAAARERARRNREDFRRMTEDVRVVSIAYPQVHDTVNAGPRIAQQITAPEILEGIGHILVDISSLPSTLYFPLIAALLKATRLPRDHPSYFGGELQVAACANPTIDASIYELGVVEAKPVGGFRQYFPSAGEGVQATVWVPTIGERASGPLKEVHNYVQPDETCPILPFPAVKPRRADELALEHRVELFHEFAVDPANIIYADERNPFDLYRTLSQLHADYSEALQPLGGVTVALSAHSSKLLSLGVLLAACEDELPVVTAPTTTYQLASELEIDVAVEENRLTTLWLEGAPYR